jgi:fatty acid/phospholipid biosynthesis enzyme
MHLYNSSQLVGEGNADGEVAAGNTGALGSMTLYASRIPGVERPAKQHSGREYTHIITARSRIQ